MNKEKFTAENVLFGLFGAKEEVFDEGELLPFDAYKEFRTGMDILNRFAEEFFANFNSFRRNPGRYIEWLENFDFPDRPRSYSLGHNISICRAFRKNIATVEYYRKLSSHALRRQLRLDRKDLKGKLQVRFYPGAIGIMVSNRRDWLKILGLSSESPQSFGVLCRKGPIPENLMGVLFYVNVSLCRSAKRSIMETVHHEIFHVMHETILSTFFPSGSKWEYLSSKLRSLKASLGNVTRNEVKYSHKKNTLQKEIDECISHRTGLRSKNAAFLYRKAEEELSSWLWVNNIVPPLELILDERLKMFCKKKDAEYIEEKLESILSLLSKILFFTSEASLPRQTRQLGVLLALAFDPEELRKLLLSYYRYELDAKS